MEGPASHDTTTSMPTTTPDMIDPTGNWKKLYNQKQCWQGSYMSWKTWKNMFVRFCFERYIQLHDTTTQMSTAMPDMIDPTGTCNITMCDERMRCQYI